MGRFTQGGVVYEELPDGQVRVVGYEDAPVQGAPTAIPLPRSPSAVARDNASIGQAQASTARTNQQIAQDGAMFAPQQQAAAAQAELARIKAVDARKEQEAKNPLNPQQLEAVQSDAMEKLEAISRIGKNHMESWLPTIGTGAETTRDWIGSSGAADIAADIESLKAGGALGDIMKMTQQTGKNPFTPMSNSDVEIIARNKGNLTQKQSPKNFFSNLKNYQDAYTRAYAGSVGMQTLNNEIERMLPTIKPEKRDFFRQRALQEYEQRMSRSRGGLLGSSTRNAPAKTKGSARFLGFED